MKNDFNKYKDLFDTMDVGVVYQNEKGQIIEINKAAERILGYPKNELLSLTSLSKQWKAIKEDGSPFPGHEHPSMVSLKTGKKVIDIIMGIFNRKLNEYRWININAVPEFRKGGKKPCQVYTTFSDITEQKKLKEQLVNFRIAIENSTNAIGMSTPEGKHYYQNKAFHKLFGEIGDDPPATLYVDKKVGREVFRTIMDGKEWDGEVEMYEKNRNILNIMLRAYPIKDNYGKIIGLVRIHRDITSQKKTEKDLQENAERLRLALEAAHANSWELNLQTGALSDSQKWIDYLGYKQGEVSSTIDDITNLIHPDDISSYQKQLQSYLEGKTPVYESEVRLRKKNGDYIWVISRGKVVEFDKKGKPVRLVGANLDITQSKLAQQALEESEQKFRYLAEESPNMIFINQNGKIVYVNRCCEKYTHYTREELQDVEFSFMSLIDQENHNLLKSKFKQHIEGKDVSPYEYRIVTKDGQKLDVINSTKLILYRNKPAILGIVTDITAQKNAENALRESEIKLQKSLTELEVIINALPGMVSVVDREYNVLLANQEVIKRFGQSNPSEVIGKPCYKVRKRLDGPCPQCSLKKAFETGESYSRISTLEEENLMGIATKAYAVPLKDKKGKIWGGVEVIMDITDLRKAEKATHDSEKKFRSLIEHSAEAITLIDRNANIIYESPSIHTLTGYEPAKRIGKNALMNVLEEDRQMLRDKLGKMISGKVKSESVRFRSVRKDGTIWWIDVTATNMLDDPNIAAVVVNYRDITSQKNAEEAIRASEEKFRRIFEEGQFGITIAGPDFRFIASNPAFCEMIGYSEEELQQMTFADITHPDRVNEDTEKVIAMREGRANQMRVEKRYVKKNGELLWGSLISTAIRDEQGKVVYYLAMVKDISDLKAAEEALQKQIIEYKSLNREYKAQNEELSLTLDKLQKMNQELVLAKEKAEESEKKYRSIVETTLEWIWETDTHGKHIFCNQAVESILGYRVEEFMQSNAFDFMENQDRELASKKYSEYIQSGSGWRNWIIRWRHKDGSLRYLESNADPVFDVRGNLIGFRGVDRDITERKQAEEELQKAKEKAEENEKKYRAAFYTSPDSININTMDGRYVDINAGFTEITGYTHSEIVGKSSLEYNIWADPNDRKKLMKGLKEKGFVENLESTFTMKSGEKRTGLMSATIITLDGKPHILSITRDISFRKKMEDDLRRAKEKAEESDRLKTAFLANMSHEIRTPMNGILGFAELLKDPDLTGKEQSKYIRIIEQSGEHMLNIINDLIDISKIESGQVELNIAPASINRMFDTLYEFFLPEAESRHLRFIVMKELTDNRSTIETDEMKLNQVLSNLIKNALKYTSAGSITIGYKLDNESMVFYVQDTGIGIRPELHEKIFERFLQGDSVSEQAVEGSGLGLSISKAFIEMLNGRIWVESEPGKGATFFVSLPYTYAEDRTEKEYKAKTIFNQMKSKLTILIAEDDDTSYFYLEEILKPHNIEVLRVYNGREAVESVASNREINMVLMDLKMPVMNGFDATKIIKQHRPELPIIAQTAYALSNDSQRSLEAGCDDYIAKPINKDVLLEKIKRLLVKKENYDSGM